MTIAIVADDLMSAADRAVPFVAKGHRCKVWFEHRTLPPLVFDVVSVNKDNRARSRDEAAQRTEAATLPLSTADILTVIGSANKNNIAQKQRLVSKDRAVEIVVDARTANSSPSRTARNALGRAKSLVMDAQSLVISTSPVGPVQPDPQKITETLGLIAVELIETLPIDGLLLTGGDTAAAIFERLGPKAMELSGELEPGIPIGLIDTPRRMAVITKAGGFGDANTLVRATTALRGQKAEAII